jgi:hypothetical protein
VTTEVGTDDLMGATVSATTTTTSAKLVISSSTARGHPGRCGRCRRVSGIGAKSVAIPYTSMQIMQNAAAMSA